MSSGDPRRARLLGLWTAGWLAAFLLAGVLRLGDLSVQWPVFAVPLLWALVAARPRRRPAWETHRSDDGWDEDEPGGWWDDPDADTGRFPRVVARPEERTDTVERPALRRPDEHARWERRRRG